MKQTPHDRLVTTVIPVYNCERYVGQAIESVLDQSHLFVDLIVVDDGSTDGSADVVQSYGQRVRYVHQENSGQSTALNLGISMAYGNYLAFLDADDLWIKDKLERQLAAFDVVPDARLIFGHSQQFISPDLDVAVAQRLQCPPGLAPGYHQGTLLTTRDVFNQVGGFETKWRAGQFLEWLLRANDLGYQSIMLPDLVMLRRLHATNFGILQPEAKADYARILKTALDRRRALAHQRESE